MKRLQDFYEKIDDPSKLENKERKVLRITDVVGLHERLNDFVSKKDIDDTLDNGEETKVLSSKQGFYLNSELRALTEVFYRFIKCNKKYSLETCKPINLRIDIEDVKRIVEEKADKKLTYTKIESDNKLYNYAYSKELVNAKLDEKASVKFVKDLVADDSITREGNKFNEADSLVKSDKNNKIPFAMVCDYISDINPKTDTNPHSSYATYLNKVTGELFICVSNLNDINHWVGSLGTEVKPFHGTMLEAAKQSKLKKLHSNYKEAQNFYSDFLAWKYIASTDNLVYIQNCIEYLTDKENILNMLNKPSVTIKAVDNKLFKINKNGLIKLLKEIRNHLIRINEYLWYTEEKIRVASDIDEVNAIEVKYGI